MTSGLCALCVLCSVLLFFLNLRVLAALLWPAAATLQPAPQCLTNTLPHSHNTQSETSRHQQVNARRGRRVGKSSSQAGTLLMHNTHQYAYTAHIAMHACSGYSMQLRMQTYMYIPHFTLSDHVVTCTSQVWIPELNTRQPYNVHTLLR